MKKYAWTMASILALAALIGAAETADYAGYLPEGARFVRQETDDGATEIEYRDADGERYELLVGPDGTVLALEADRKTKAESAATLTVDEAFGILTKTYPDARQIAAALDAKDGRAVWVVLFEDAGALNAYELDAGTGEVLAYDRIFGYSRDADPTVQIYLSYPGAEISKRNLGFEDGKAVYEGEATVDDFKYDFEADYTTGQLLKWEMDD